MVKNVRHFRHHGKNCVKIDGENGEKTMAKMARKSMAKWQNREKIDEENGENRWGKFFLSFRYGENREKNGEWR